MNVKRSSDTALAGSPWYFRAEATNTVFRSGEMATFEGGHRTLLGASTSATTLSPFAMSITVTLSLPSRIYSTTPLFNTTFPSFAETSSCAGQVVEKAAIDAASVRAVFIIDHILIHLLG